MQFLDFFNVLGTESAEERAGIQWCTTIVAGLQERMQSVFQTTTECLHLINLNQHAIITLSLTSKSK